jgi:hypothetical protein
MAVIGNRAPESVGENRMQTSQIMKVSYSDPKNKIGAILAMPVDSSHD